MAIQRSRCAASALGSPPSRASAQKSVAGRLAAHWKLRGPVRTPPMGMPSPRGTSKATAGASSFEISATSIRCGNEEAGIRNE